MLKIVFQGCKKVRMRRKLLTRSFSFEKVKAKKERMMTVLRLYYTWNRSIWQFHVNRKLQCMILVKNNKFSIDFSTTSCGIPSATRATSILCQEVLPCVEFGWTSTELWTTINLKHKIIDRVLRTFLGFKHRRHPSWTGCLRYQIQLIRVSRKYHLFSIEVRTTRRHITLSLPRARDHHSRTTSRHKYSNHHLRVNLLNITLATTIHSSQHN